MLFRSETAQVSLTFPKAAMPDGGYPLVVYFHGSGGVARELVDGGDKGSPADTLSWPANVLAKRGFAMIVANANMQLIYGTFAAVPLFLSWLYLVWILVLSGAILVRTLGLERDEAE